MFRFATRRPHAHDTEFDLRGITRGSRLLCWVQGRTDLLWQDSRCGRIVLRIARRIGRPSRAAWPGPIVLRPARRAPLLSWFVLPGDASGATSFVAQLDQALKSQITWDTEALATRLMRRLLDMSGSVMPRHEGPQGATPPAQAAGQTVALIDERVTSPLDPASAHERRQRFKRMLDIACTRHPGAQFEIIRSNDAGTGPWLTSPWAAAIPRDAQTPTQSHRRWAALLDADHVYVLSASEGVLPILARRPVHVYGTPYYAGWGLSDDDAPMPERTARPTLPAFFHAVFVQFARYLDPHTHRPGTLDAAIDCVQLQHAVEVRFSALEHIAGVRFQWWKRPFATPFLSAGGGTLRWIRGLSELRTGEYAALWGARHRDDIGGGIHCVRIEDGFIHSNGLGSDMSAPWSQVIDTRGLYFDPSQPNDLTDILNHSEFDASELQRAARLRASIVEAGITKYNLGRRTPDWRPPSGRTVALVPGQVADDASIKFGTLGITTSDALLREVRIRRPDAFIVYKPHPDVLSGNRQGLIDAQTLADVVDTHADLLSLIEIADEIHTLSSLAGFDALLRGKTVFTYGLPFYAGWGLTHDAITPLAWRERRLSLDMLVAGALIRYPLYWDWRLRLFSTPEAAVTRLAPHARRPLGTIRGNRTRIFVKIFRWTRNAISHWATRIG
ncbi:capsular polysaccharide export protein, LipB/KpsS family [Burkholderia singularis]|uniref:Capsular polysaccharide biosynthesis/export periplasmic protein WcbA n=1 Tax=Burkholderia singularis TaxID=1503053 RepID=A0A238HCT3_9BURK|nr:capsular biosynthesis protein [Burkholderia singularis]SMG02885.1 Capsular polysaccharide biosynthesis/export periplasmic protein WcbA [Burkholderia singularis]